MAHYLLTGKTANVVPIFKSGEQRAVDNYRPVSLTSMAVKSLERLIHNHIMSFLSDKLLCDNQHGFRPLRSRVTQLLQLVHEWLSILDERGSVDAIFLDFAKTQAVCALRSLSIMGDIQNLIICVKMA